MHSHFKILSFTILLFFSFQIITAQQSSLSVEKIMKDPKGGYKPHKGSSKAVDFPIQKAH